METNKRVFFLYSDGGARGNPGPSGAGVVIKDRSGKKIYQISEYLGELTNNQAEYQALILGLKKASDESIKNLVCFLDSELLVKQLNKKYKVKDDQIRNLYNFVLEFVDSFDEISFKHVSREKNKEADFLVNKALDLKKSELKRKNK